MSNELKDNNLLDTLKVENTEGLDSLTTPPLEDEGLLNRGNLLDNSDSIADVSVNAATSKKEVLTEVASIASEEARTGVKTEIPSVEELVNRASMSFVINRQKLGQVFAGLSSKAKNRVLAAIIDLPTSGLPVGLKSDSEKLAFGLGQRALADRFLLTQHHINEEIQRIKAEKQTEQTKENSNG